MMGLASYPVAVMTVVALLASPLRFPAVPDVPELEAEAWVLIDAATGVTLLEHNADEELAMASVTKLMTALVVRRHADLDDRVRISEAAAEIGEAEVGLAAGEVWSVKDLLAAILVRSGNDAAYALAEHVGGTLEGFAALMNEMAVELGLEHSHFVNPHGLDADGHYTSANDLTVIARAVLDDEVLGQLTRTRFIRFKPAPTGEERSTRNTNLLLGRYPGIVGMKTGYTSQAGRVLVSVLESEGNTFIAVVLGSEDHFADTAALYDYITQRISLRERLLSPLVEAQGGGGTAGSPELSAETEAIIKILRPLPTGADQTSAWGETPGSQAIIDMVKEMLPMTLGGSG